MLESARYLLSEGRRFLLRSTMCVIVAVDSIIPTGLEPALDWIESVVRPIAFDTLPKPIICLGYVRTTRGRARQRWLRTLLESESIEVIKRTPWERRRAVSDWAQRIHDERVWKANHRVDFELITMFERLRDLNERNIF